MATIADLTSLSFTGHLTLEEVDVHAPAESNLNVFLVLPCHEKARASIDTTTGKAEARDAGQPSILNWKERGDETARPHFDRFAAFSAEPDKNRPLARRAHGSNPGRHLVRVTTSGHPVAAQRARHGA